MTSETTVCHITLGKNFHREFPDISPQQLRSDLIHNSWVLPNNHSGKGRSRFQIVGMGKTANKAMPTGCSISGIEMGLFAKPIDSVPLAEREFETSELAYLRGVHMPEMVALMKFNDDAVLLSQLYYDVFPLGSTRLDYQLGDRRVMGPKDVLEFYIGGIAEMHNLGVAHGDLHTQNIGYRFYPNTVPTIFIFDLESGMVLKPYDLDSKNRGVCTPNQHGIFDAFERQTIDDLAVFAAHLKFGGFEMRKKCLLSNIVEMYENYRKPSYGVQEGKNLYQQLASNYDRLNKSINHRQRYKTQ
jgi:hypothetical protein